VGVADPLSLSLTTDCPAYRVGSPLTVRVQAVARGSCQIQRGDVALVADLWTGEATEAGQHVYGGVSTPTLQTTTGRLTLARAELGMTGPVPAGGSFLQDTVLAGQSLGPSCEGLLSYRVELEVLLADGRTLRAGVPVHVLSPQSLYAHVEGVTRGSGSWSASQAAFGIGGPRQENPLTGRSTKRTLQRAEAFLGAEKPEAGPFQACALEFQIPRASARPGQVVVGTLRVQPLRPVRIKQVHVALRHKKIGRGWSDHTGFNYVVKVPPSPILQDDASPKVVLARKLQLVQPVDLAFTVQVPPAAVPTLLTDRCSSRWYVIGYARQPGMSIAADHVLQEINVYTGE